MMDTLDTYGRPALRLLGLAAVGGGVLALAWLGWQWKASVTVGNVAVTGVRHAAPDTLRRLARVDSGTVMDSVRTSLVADRVARHPWVRTAAVTKQHTRRTLRVAVTERTPAALVIGEDGRPAYYLDPRGHAMPCAGCTAAQAEGAAPDSTAPNVPLVRGLSAEYHPLDRVAPPRLRAVLSALPATGTAPLVGEVQVRPDSSIHLRTTPVGEHGPMAVRMGDGPVRPQLRRLRAFAEQVLAAPGPAAGPIAEIDLRFDDQIVTREHPLDES